MMDTLRDSNVLSKLGKDAYILEIKGPTTKERLKEIFGNVGLDLEGMLRSGHKVLTSGTVEMLKVDGKLLFVYKLKNTFYISLKDDHVRNISIDHGKKTILFMEDGLIVEDIHRIKSFIDMISEIKRDNSPIVLYDIYSLYDSTGLVNEVNYNYVIGDEELALMVPYFRDKDASSLELSIVLMDTLEKVGLISYDLHDDNFKYCGNISYSIREKFRGCGYATKALGFIKQLICEYEDTIDKTMYIAIEKDNKASERVAIKNGASLFYEGEVPSNDKLRTIGKVNYVKIYTIPESDL